jgi:hypothetical protein
MHGMPLWTFVCESNRDVLAEWTGGDELPLRLQARLDQKLDLLRFLSFELLTDTHVVVKAAPPDIYRLKVAVEPEFQILLCLESDGMGYTLLGIAPKSVDSKRAIERRNLILSDPAKHRRKLNERD